MTSDPRTRRSSLGLRIGGLMLGVAVTLGCSGMAAPAAGVAHLRMGINLNGPADWNTELPFVDVFRFSRAWISQRKGAAWGKGPPLELDAHGWVKRLEPDCWAETLLCTIEGGHYPDGRYTVLYEGEGKIEFGGAARVVSEQPGRLVLEVNPSRGAMFLRLMRTNPENYVRNLRVVMPGFEQTFRQDPWNPSFLRHWRGMACLRFMDWMKTNGSKLARWSDRPTIEDATFTTKGVPLELMIELANRLEADPWFCLPHQADDDFVRRFAKLVRARLDPRRKVYIEYSNEVWNSIFAQHHWAGERGMKLGFADQPWEAAWRYTAYRSVQIFKIWEQVFGGTDRIVRVLPTQAANPYVSKQVVEFRDAWRHADALAIAPYISMNIPAKGNRLTTAQVAQWTVDQVLDHVEKVSLPRAIEWIRKQKQIADARGLRLVAYEAGQHLVGIQGGENNDTVTRLLHQANAHPRMGRIYDRYFAAWEQAGGDLLCHYSSVGRWSKWGSWGLLQYADDDPSASPKFRAVMRWAKKWGQPVTVP